MNRASTIIAGVLAAGSCLAGCAREEQVVQCERKFGRVSTEAVDTGLTCRLPWPTELSQGPDFLAFKSEEDMAAFIAALKGKSPSEVDRMVVGTLSVRLISEDRGSFGCPETDEMSVGQDTEQGQVKAREGERTWEILSPRQGKLVVKLEKGIVSSAQFVESEAEEDPGLTEPTTLKSLEAAAEARTLKLSELDALAKHIEDLQWDDPNCLSFASEAELSAFVSKLKGKSLTEVEETVGKARGVVVILDDSYSMAYRRDKNGAGEKDDEAEAALSLVERHCWVRNPRKGMIVLKFEKDIVASAEFVEAKANGSPEPAAEDN